MMDPQYGVTPETMFIITDDLGNKVCYASTGQTKVMVDEYDPDSDIFHNLEGPPQLAIMVCSDYNKTTGEWDSRVIFYAELLRQA